MLASLQPGSVNAEMVTIKLCDSECFEFNIYGPRTYAINRLMTAPVPVRIKLTRTSFRARASRTNLSYFSYRTGMISINAEKSMPKMVTKRVNPESPAMIKTRKWWQQSAETRKHTRSYFPFCLEGCYTGKTSHGEKVEEYLRDMEYDGWF